MSASPELPRLVASLRERLVSDALEPGASTDPHRRIRELVERDAGVLDPFTRAELESAIVESSLGLGPLEPLMRDQAVEEIMVNGAGAVWVERAGQIELTTVQFDDAAALRHAIERILAPLGRRADEAEPLCDARLPDGSRVNVVLPPLAIDGPVLTIRRFRRRDFTAPELVASGTLDIELCDLLRRAVRARLNVIVSGGTGSGKTTLLNVLSSFIPPGERIVTIEDAAELRLQQPHVVRLESRPASVEGRGEVTIRALVRNALRMRPDRIVVGEVRGSEALDMLGAMSSGHDGSMSCVHAGDPAEAVRRLETLALMADVGLPHAAVREQIASAVDLIVQLARGRAGERCVTSLARVTRVAAGPGVRELWSLETGLLPCGVAFADELDADG